jgi:hypothetical protein
MTDSQYLDEIWGEILSRRPARIQRMYASLDASSQQEVLRHLQRMTTDDGWQEVQIASATFALRTIDPSSIKHA